MRGRKVAVAMGVGILLTLFLPVGSAVAHEVDTPSGGAAAESLENFEHVFNYDPDESPSSEGTDLDFWTAEVPLRDYTTGEFVDENGEPLLPDEEGNPPEPITAFRDFVVVGSDSVGARIFDITDPERPQLVSQVECAQPRNDPAVKRFTDTDGNAVWLLALTKDQGGRICLRNPVPRHGENHNAGIAVFDVTDPFAWQPLYTVQFQGGAHNFTFHPTKPFGWASNGDLPGALPPPSVGLDMIPIIDFTDPYKPDIDVIQVRAGSPHDLEFSRDGTRAYVAAENHYEIYDATEPGNPQLVGTTPNLGSYAHGAYPTPDKSIMITNNESLVLGGFVAPGSGVCPGEGLGFYDIDGARERAPVLLGSYVPQEVEPLSGECTSHFGKVADNNRIITVGWYTLGARVVDFSTPSRPIELGAAVMADSNVWSAKFYKGPYLYTGDINRGFDVFKWTGDDPAPWEDLGAGPLQPITLHVDWAGADGRVECSRQDLGTHGGYSCEHRGDSGQAGTAGDEAHHHCGEISVGTFPLLGVCTAEFGFTEDSAPAVSTGVGDTQGTTCATGGSVAPGTAGTLRYYSSILNRRFDITVEVESFTAKSESNTASHHGEVVLGGVSESSDGKYLAKFTGQMAITDTFPCDGPEKRGLFSGSIDITPT